MTRRFNDDEIRILKQLTDEVFVISNKPQLAAVQKMKSIQCEIMNSGIRKVGMDYYFCKTCDKEHKCPICKICAERCHKGHLILDYVRGSEDHPQICMCGYKCHNMMKQKKEEVDFTEQNSIKCYFNQLSLNAGLYEYYIGINGRKVCTFCFHFCCRQLVSDDDDTETQVKAFKKYQFRKISVSREEFTVGIELGQIQCECLLIPESKHKSSDHLFVFLNELNHPVYKVTEGTGNDKDKNDKDIDDYFSALQPTKIINLFFTSIELFESVYSGFIGEYNEFIEGLTQKNDNLTINTIFSIGYANFASNSNNCKYNFYFNERINAYFTTLLAKFLFEKNLKLNDLNNTFIINFIQGYIKFRLGSYLESAPRYLLTDLFNMNPLQRRIWMIKNENLFISCGLAKENLIHVINNMLERLIRQRPDIEESIQVFIQLFRVMKVYTRFYFVTKDEIIETCKILDDFFGYLSEFYSNEESVRITLKEERVKLFKTVIKIVTYFSLYINDETYMSFFDISNIREEVREDKEKTFFHSFTEASKLTNKILVHIAEGVRQEHEIVMKLISQGITNDPYDPNEENNSDEEEVTYEDYRVALMQILHIIQINMDFALQENDHYLISMRRSINPNLTKFLCLIRNEFNDEDEQCKSYIKSISEFSDHLERLYWDFFNTPHISLNLIQNYISSVTSRLIRNFNGNFENLVDKQNNIYTLEFAGVFRPNPAQKGWKMTQEFLANGCPNFLFSLTKVFRLSKDKSVFSDDFVRNVLKVCVAYINDNPDNAIIGLSIPVLKNLVKIPRQYLCCVLDYMLLGLNILIKNNVELSFGFFIAKYGFTIYHKTTDESKANKGRNLPNIFYCLVKLLKLLELLFALKISDQKQFIEFMRTNLEDFLNEDLIECYKLYLINVSKDFKENRKYYTSKRIFDNIELFNFQFKDYILLTNTFNSSLMFKIFLRLMTLLTKTFDVGALETIPEFLYKFLTKYDITNILTITTLDINLRIELIKYFRMIYIDLCIDKEKLDQYRFEFHQELETETQEMSDGLLSVDSLKVFLFLQRLLKLSGYNFNSEESKMEYKLLFFEVKNFKKIILTAKHCDKSVYMSYLENGIILPIKVYLNKVLSTLMTIKGDGLLQLYRFCYYILKMKEFVIVSNLVDTASEEEKGNTLFKGEKFTDEMLNEVKTDIETITNPNFPVLNYKEIYLLINKHIMSLVNEPTSTELVLYLSEYEKYEAKAKTQFRNFLEKKGVDFDDENIATAWKAYEMYIEQKNILDKSSLKANFDDTFINGEITVRIVVMRYLFFLATNKAKCFEEDGVNMLLKLLKHEPEEAQNAIFAKTDKEDLPLNIPLKISKLLLKQSMKNKNYKQINDFKYLANTCFDNLLSSIFNQYNPTSIELSDEYYYSCHIIKVFKYLCESHNQDFKNILMNAISFDIGNRERLSFYDMMIFILDKIIIIAGWENSKTEDQIQGYFFGIFSCIVELLIEIVRGAKPENFNSFLIKNAVAVNGTVNKQEDLISNDNKSGANESKVSLSSIGMRKNCRQRYLKGTALKILLQNIKGIMFEGFTESETLFSVRKILMDFILSFMEEINVPQRVQNLIMSLYHPDIVIKSICVVLKVYYIKKEQKTLSSNSEETQKMVRYNQIVDQNIQKNKAENDLTKVLRYIKFNNDLCNYFSKLYFEDPEFSKSKYFAICNAYYKYFLLTYIQFRNEETIDFWNRIHNKSETTLESYNRRARISMTDEKMRNYNDESDYEAFYIIKLFNELTKSVLVKSKPDSKPMYVIYTLHPYSKYLTADSKDEFLRNVDRKDRYTKLYDLIENTQYFKLEIEYNYQFLKRASFLKFTTKVNYHVLGYITFWISFVINMLLLITMHESGVNYYGFNTMPIIEATCCVCVSLEILIVIFWVFTKYELYYQIEKAKYKEKHRELSNLDDSKLSFLDKFSINYQAIVGKGELHPFIIFIVFTLLGVIMKKCRFLIAFGLLSILPLNQTLNNILSSITLKGNSLMWTSLFTLVLLYEYAGWGFYYQRDRFYDEQGRETPEEMCRSLLYCFLTNINNGMRWHAGVGKVVRSESGLLHFWAFVHRFFYDLIFFWIIEAMMLKIVYGIILDSFSELRQAHYLIESDIANNCFICHIKKDDCEKNNISFAEHTEKKHNIWDYIFYMITLRMQENASLSAIDAGNREKMMLKNVDWMPDAALDPIDEDEKRGKQNE